MKQRTLTLSELSVPHPMESALLYRVFTDHKNCTIVVLFYMINEADY